MEIDNTLLQTTKMVIATFWSSYIAAYKLYRYFDETDSVAVCFLFAFYFLFQ